uniref:T9SS type A sorting domain-containing protein n=1 Tax=candidate division WOR-3 bacterium TaxID=2052148 RepID=A0A7C3UWB2_UNCW3
MIRVLTSGPPDVGCTKIEVPIGTVDSGGVITPACSVYNYGTIAASYPVRMKIGNFYNQTAAVSNHPPGTYRYVTFPNWNINQPRGSYAVVCSTELAGDGNNSNDRRTGQVFIRILDVGAVAIVYPQDSVKIDSFFTPQARARNYGNTPVSFPTTFSIIRGTETLYQKVVNITLNPDSIRTVAFPETAFGIIGWYRTRFRTTLTGDMNPGNDVVQDSFKVYEPLVGIKGEETKTTQRIGLQIPSNPTIKLLRINYFLPEKEKATLKVYNAFGELCYSEESDKGFFSLKLPAGIYLLRLETKGYKEERKLILVK